jgi:ABC-type multidrug transport system permease subunit
MTSKKYFPLAQLIVARLREFSRQPETIFWVYGFPMLIVIALGIAFRNRPVEHIAIAVQDTEIAEHVASALSADPKFQVQRCDAANCRKSLKTGKTALVVIGGAGPHYEYFYDPTRPESVLARSAVDDALERAAGRKDVATSADKALTEPGARYIDFLVPGLLGMNLMGGGLWGIGYAIVDMRIRKLLKCFVATPMKRHHFLTGIVCSRFIFLVPEITFILFFAWLVFDVRVQGNLLSLIFLVLLGAFTFSGIGLLVASRANTMQTVSGLINAIMVPMWVTSGVFFSSDRFPPAVQPVINLLPLTPLINSLRAVMLEGTSITHLWSQMLILAVWGIAASVVSLRHFRWM